jgi:hypothetical protein
MTTITQIQSTYSDVHKEAYGFRPRNPHHRQTWTVADYHAELECLYRICEANAKQREADEEIAIRDFEARVAKLIGMGAKDRETAIKWLADAEGTGEDREYLCYCLGLPYGFFNKTPACPV